MIIGFILGPLLESAFDQTMTLSDGSFMIFLTHPFSVVLLLLTVAAVFSIARARLRRSKIAQLAQEDRKDEIWGRPRDRSSFRQKKKSK